MRTPYTSPARALAARFLSAFRESEATGETIDECGRMDALADLAAETIAEALAEELGAHADGAQLTFGRDGTAPYYANVLPEGVDVFYHDEKTARTTHDAEAIRTALELGAERYRAQRAARLAQGLELGGYVVDHDGAGRLTIADDAGAYAAIDVHEDGDADVHYYDEAQGIADGATTTTIPAHDYETIVAEIATVHDRALAVRALRAGGAR